MPAVDAPRGNNAAAKPPPVPKAPPTSTRTGNNPRGVAIAPVRTPAPPRALTTGANPRGTAIVQPSHGVTPNDVQAEHPDPKVTIGVFRAQSHGQQRAVVQGALKNPSLPASKIILNYLKAYPGQASALAQMRGQGLVPALAHALSPSNVYGGSGKVAAGAPSGQFGAVMFGGPSGAKQLLANAGKDVVNLPAETLATVGTLGGDVLAGKPGKAASDLVSPFVQLAEHPAQSFYQHPVNTYLMATGALHGASRLAAAPVRALASPDSALGRAVSTERPGVTLTGKLTHERPPYSKSATVKAGQVAVEKVLYTRNSAGELVPRHPFVRQRQIKQGVGELIGTRERIRVTNRQAVRDAREAAIRAPLAKRVGTAAKRTLAFGSKKAVIPGADVLARIADGTIRRPDTIVADLRKHLAQVSANRASLLDEPKALKAHDAYVKQINAALSNEAFLKNPASAFRAAEAYAKDYAPVEAQARALGHFGTMTSDLLQRRELAHYAVTHMGAHMDPMLGLMRAGTKGEVRALRSNLILKADRLETEGGVAALAQAAKLREASKQAWDTQTVPLRNEEIVAHLKGPKGTGGRMPAFTSDRVRFEPEQQARSAAYVSSERRPLTATKKNTLYAYTHGLTEPGHAALTEQHMAMRGIVDAHHAQNAYAETLALSKRDGSYWNSYTAAKHDAPAGYRPINLSQPFHPQQSLDLALQDVHSTAIEDEALRHSLDLNARLQPGKGDRWGVIRNESTQALQQAQSRISPDSTLRTFRGLNNQFRTVALSTSARHVLGVAQENIIRDIAHGVGFRSWVTGRRILSKVEELRPERGRDVRTSLTGGQVAGMTEAGKTYLVSEHWQGTNAYPFLKSFETVTKTPGLRQARTAWRAWTKFAIGSTKHLLEQQHQIAGLGKAALREHGYAEAARTDGFMGLAQRAFALHGQMLEDAAKGLFDPAKLRQTRATINQMYGKWTDLSPGAQTLLMFSPFGLWWVNSARFLMRMPVDQPVKTAVLASATTGTQQERQAQGLDMFAPGHLPLYEQGGIPVGGKILAQNYYSPFGVANDPLSTGQSLIQPWLSPIMAASLPNAVNWLGKPLSAPGQNTNRFNEKTPAPTQQAQAIINSVLSSFLPLYTKAQQVAEGGASPYDVSPGGILPPLVRGKSPATKTPAGGPLAGLEKAVQPFRTYKKAGGQGAYKLGGGTGSASSGGYILGSGGQQSGGGGYILGSGG